MLKVVPRPAIEWCEAEKLAWETRRELGQPDLDVVELFGGSESIVRGFVSAGRTGRAFDCRIFAFEHIRLLLLFVYVLSLGPGTHFWAHRLPASACFAIQGINQAHNIHVRSGLVIAIKLISRCKKLVILTPNCATWIWLSRGSTLRGLDA